MRVTIKNASAYLFLCLGGSWASSCAPSPGGLTDAPPVLENYAAIMHASYDDARADAVQLRTSAEPLFSSSTTPTAAALTAAQSAWRDARVHYMQTEVGRFYGGPIADHSAYTNEWPIDEAQLDYVQDSGGALLFGGIVNSPSALPTLDATSLRAANLPDGSETVTVGFHAIEFLLWGQDLRADGAGQRAYTDYVDGMQMNADRRRTYLDVTTQMLVDDLTAVRDAWAPATPGNYRAEFVALAPEEGVRHILVGLIRLSGGEVGDDRILPAYTNKLQEDEHSCFSDNTSADLENDLVGVENVYLGRYVGASGTVSGPGLTDLVRARDAALDARVQAAIAQVLADLRAWPEVASCPSAALQGMCPFDQLFLGVDTDPGRMAMWNVHLELEALATMLRTEVAPALGITITDADLSLD